MKLRHAYPSALAILALPLIAASTEDQQVPPSIRYEAHVPAGGVAPAAGTLTNPYRGDKQSAQTGESLFSQMNCDGCHGGGGLGWEGPSLADGRWRYGGADEEIFYSIYYGRPKGMPAYGGVLGTEGVWLLVTYLKSLPVPDAVPTQSYEESGEIKTPVKEAAPPSQAATQAQAAAPVSGKPEALITKYGCVACHSVDRKVVGPAFRDVAAKYRAQNSAADTLAQSIKNGSTGRWGQIPMPPNAQVPDRDVPKLVDWILSLK
jgi:cytochrome c551/c552